MESRLTNRICSDFVNQFSLWIYTECLLLNMCKLCSLYHSGHVCDWLAGIGGCRESSAFAWEVLQEHSRTVPGIAVGYTNLLIGHWGNVWPCRCGASLRTVRAQLTFLRAWEDSCKPLCSVTAASSKSSIIPPRLLNQIKQNCNPPKKNFNL